VLLPSAKLPLCVRLVLSQFLFFDKLKNYKNLRQPTLHRAANRLTAFFCNPLAPLAGVGSQLLGLS